MGSARRSAAHHSASPRRDGSAGQVAGSATTTADDAPGRSR
ncbi:hypothetical protein [Streptomyces sp. NPDC097640]